MATTNNINNLNIFTFIKDIYNALKNLNICINGMKTNIDSRLEKIENNQQILLTRIELIEELIVKLNNTRNENNILDKNIESQLLEKMHNLNQILPNEKLELKPGELTIANILENNYNLDDINKSLSLNTNTNNLFDFDDDNVIRNQSHNNMNTNIYNNYNDIKNTDNKNTDNKNNVKKETIENLLF